MNEKKMFERIKGFIYAPLICSVLRAALEIVVEFVPPLGALISGNEWGQSRNWMDFVEQLWELMLPIDRRDWDDLLECDVENNNGNMEIEDERFASQYVEWD